MTGASEIRGGQADRATPPVRGVAQVDPVDDVLRALELFSLSPLDLGGVHLRGWHGPRRQALLGWLRRACSSGEVSGWHVLPHHTEAEQLDAATDLVESLRQGRPVIRAGLLERFAGGVVVLQRAERISPGLAARLAAALDERRFALVVLDESLPDEAAPASVLLERLALAVDLRDETAWRALDALASLDRSTDLLPGAVREPPLDLARVSTGARGLTELCRATMLLGIDSMRRVLQASVLARLSALEAHRHPGPGADVAQDSDLAFAIRQVLLPRARSLPSFADQIEDPPTQDAPEEASEPDPIEPPPEPLSDPLNDSPHEPPNDPPELDPSQLPDGASERLVEAALSALPEGLLTMMASQMSSRAVAARGSGSGAQTAKGRGRARSVGSRRGRPRAQERVHLLATLRAALPWQRVRTGQPGAPSETHSREQAPQPPSRMPIRFHPDDLHVHRERRRRGSTTLFVVDASGSTALQRLAEAKGAVELLLADCYVRRDRVALVSFRGAGAELLLPPTRSLVAARRALTALPGGGGSPVAAGLDMAARVALQLGRAGDDVTLVLLTDGRANLSRDGQPGRERAAAEAKRVARELAPLARHRVLIDTSVRPEPAAQALAGALGARYLPMPFARARAIRDSIAAATR